MSKLRVISTGSKGNCYMLECNGKWLVLDAGTEVWKIISATGYAPGSIEGVLITHRHGDHSRAAADLWSRGLTVYSEPDFAQAAGLDALKPNVRVQLGSFSICAFRLPHEDVPCYGYLIWMPDGSVFLYATDYSYIPFDFTEQRVNYMLVECNYLMWDGLRDTAKYEHVIKGHAEAKVTADFVKASSTDALKAVYICHMSESMSKRQQEKIKRLISEAAGDARVEMVKQDSCFELER